jgi:RNA ligase
MFPQITKISDLLPFVKDNTQIRVKDGVFGTKIVSYQVQDSDTFTGANEAYERECRGITFYADGTLAARTLNKFFNIGEREDIKPENLDWGKVTRLMVKRDGSMVTPVLLENGDIKYKTKNTFDSKEAILANQISEAHPNSRLWLMGIFCKGLTPTFEITSAKFPIVLQYNTDELILLHVRENISGRYLSEQELIDLQCPFELVQNIQHLFLENGKVSWAKLKHYAENTEGEEGVVVQFDQEMVKLKTAWYSELHKSVTFTRWRDIAKTVLSNNADDLKGAFSLLGRSITPIVEVQTAIEAKIREAKLAVHDIILKCRQQSLSQKEVAIMFKTHSFFPMIMATFSGKEIDWFSWYEKKHLGDWPLEVIPTHGENNV